MKRDLTYWEQQHSKVLVNDNGTSGNDLIKALTRLLTVTGDSVVEASSNEIRVIPAKTPTQAQQEAMMDSLPMWFWDPDCFFWRLTLRHPPSEVDPEKIARA